MPLNHFILSRPLLSCLRSFPASESFPRSQFFVSGGQSIAMILVFWMFIFKPAFSLPSFTFIKRLFSSYLLSTIRVVSSAYLRLLVFLLALLIPACASSSLAFCMMYSAYKLNKQGDSIQPWCTPITIWNQSVVPCPVLDVASWHAYRFLRRWVRWSGITISLRIFHTHTHKELCTVCCDPHSQMLWCSQ